MTALTTRMRFLIRAMLTYLEEDRTSSPIHLLSREQEMRGVDAIAPYFFDR